MIDTIFGFLDLPERTVKPRETGITHVIDRGLGANAFVDMLSTGFPHIDIVKAGWGTAYTMHPTVTMEKIKQCHQGYGIPFCLGGTLLEICYTQDKIGQFVNALNELGITYVEVSSGVVDMNISLKWALVKELLAAEFEVLVEVGSKSADVVAKPRLWLDEIERMLDLGAWKVILEARESGTVGLAKPTGEIRCRLIEEIVSVVSPDRLIFEAPRKAQQVWFIKEFGANVNLGNIAPDDVIALETLRLGLRGDTLGMFHRKKERV